MPFSNKILTSFHLNRLYSFRGQSLYNIYILLLLFVQIFCTFSVKSQQLPVLQQYILQPSLLNPGITGSSECIQFRLTDRHQWLGFPGAPKTQILTAESTFTSGKKSHGLGLHLYNDINGAQKQLGGNIIYAFHFYLNRRKTLKMGLGLSGTIYQATLDERDFSNVTDPVVNRNLNRKFNFDASTGVYIYHDKFFAGFSAVQILPAVSTFHPFTNTRTFYIYSGTDIKIPGQVFSFHPSVLYSTNRKGEMHIDLNPGFVYRDNYWIIFSYRHLLNEFPGQPNSLVTYLGMNYRNFTFGYGFDIGLTALQKHHFGSHEFMLGYKICPFKSSCPAYR
jgi:type IX secretion system PorP/SprF family membrane protein